MFKIILALLPVVFCQLLQAGEFAVSPMVINIEGSRNKNIPFEFTIKAQKRGRVALNIYDLNQIETGHMGFVAGSKSNKDSKANWIKIKDREFSLKAGEFVVAKGVIKIPQKANGQHLAAIMVEEKQAKEGKDGITVNVRYAVILKIDAKKNKSKRIRTKTTFDNLSFSKVEGGWEFSGYFNNLSKTEGKLNAELQLRNKKKKLIGKLDLKTLSAWQRSEDGSMVYPGSRVKIFGTLPENITTGAYQVRIKNKFNERNQPIFRRTVVLKEEIGTSPDQAEANGIAGS